MTLSEIPAPILDLPGQTPALAAQLEAWANINSGSGNAAGLERMAGELEASFAQLPGALVDRPALPGALCRALRVRMRPAAHRQVLLSGHFDTVYGADHAFQTCSRPDAETLRGPGVADMKGGLVVMLAALIAFEQSPGADPLGWEVLLTPDEETGSLASAPQLLATAGRHDFALVFEPARPGGDLVRSRMGTGRFTATCLGRAAHAARVPNDGRNAIVALADFVVAANRLPGELHSVLLNAGSIRGGSETINVVPDFAEVVFDVRVSDVAGQVAIRRRLEELAAARTRDGISLSISGAFNRPPKEYGPAEQTAFAAWQQASRDLNLAPFTWVHSGGGSDGNFLSAAGLPNLDGVGVVGDNLHSDRECCRIATLAERAQLAALFLSRVASGEIVLPMRSKSSAKPAS